MIDPRQTPVVVLVFNRPELTVRLIKRLAEIQPRQLLVVADGPRPGRKAEAEKVAAVRTLFDQLPWPCEVRRNFSEVNLGCAIRVSSGITWAFQQVEEAIILEDDCLPTGDFFLFCTELLARYRNDERIGSISGTDFTLGYPGPPESYFFSRYNLFWGWATWRRAWAHYDHGMTVVADGRLDGILRRVFDKFRSRYYWRMLLERTYTGRINSWGYRWLLSCWSAEMLGIQPKVNMIENAGFNASGTHTTHDVYGLSSVGSFSGPITHPEQVRRDALRDDVIEDRVYSRSLARRVRWLVGRLVTMVSLK